MLEVSGGADDAAATIPLRATTRNLEDPTSAKICAHCILSVLNTSQRIVSFKVLTNAQNRYSIRPAVGILQPSQSLDITVGVSRKHANDPAGVILLRYVKLPTDWSLQHDLASFWSSAPKGKVKALKLVQTVFEPDPTNYSMHSSFSGTSSAHGNGSPVLDADSDSRVTPASATSGILGHSNQSRDAESNRNRPAVANETSMHPLASATASSNFVHDPTRVTNVATDSNGAVASLPQQPNSGSQCWRVAEISQAHLANLDVLNSPASFVPVELHRAPNSLADDVNDDGGAAGARSDSRASTLSDYSHRTDDPALGMDLDMVAAVERLRAAVSSVKDRPPFEPPPHMHRRSQAKVPISSADAKSTATAPVAAPSSRSKISNETPSANGETPNTIKHSRYPPVEACVSSISRMSSADPSFLQRLFPSALLSDQPVFVKMDPHTLQLSEGQNEELLMLLRWKDVVALSVRTDSTVATILLLLQGNSGNVASCFRDIKVCDSLVSDVYHKLHLLSIKGSADTICRMAVHASRCPGNSLQPLPHVRQCVSCFRVHRNSPFLQWLWIATQCRFPGSARLRALLCNSALSLPHVRRFLFTCTSQHALAPSHSFALSPRGNSFW